MTASRREQAVQLRLAGLSRSQIADALGLGSGGEPLSTWLKDIPPPAWTRRPRAKDDLRETAVAMRKEGRSYREIREVVGVSKSTLSLWLRDVPLSEDQRQALALRSPEGATRRAVAIRASAAQRRTTIESEARAQIACLSESELFVAGVVAYWAEGAKNKPWRTGARVSFLNSDPGMIQLSSAGYGYSLWRRTDCSFECASTSPLTSSQPKGSGLRSWGSQWPPSTGRASSAITH